MGAKSRGNFKTGVCLETCQGRCCNPNKESISERIVYGSVTNGTSGVTVIEYNGSDGSKLEKPMSRTYMDSIRSRTGNEQSLPGDYGSGKRIR